ncbi:MAG TPA: hypothetical protein VGC22_00970, partial [Chitinophaga sp.]
MKTYFILLLAPLFLLLDGCCKKADYENPFTAGKSAGTIGFAVSGNYLFCADLHNLVGYDISNPALPVKAGFTPFNGSMDTVFAIA